MYSVTLHRVNAVIRECFLVAHVSRQEQYTVAAEEAGLLLGLVSPIGWCKSLSSDSVVCPGGCCDQDGPRPTEHRLSFALCMFPLSPPSLWLLLPFLCLILFRMEQT